MGYKRMLTLALFVASIIIGGNIVCNHWMLTNIVPPRPAPTKLRGITNNFCLEYRKNSTQSENVNLDQVTDSERKDITTRSGTNELPDTNAFTINVVRRKERITKSKTNYERGHKELCKNSWQKAYTRLHQHLLERNENRFMVITCPAGGWGNRLRNILSTFHFAVLVKRAFVISCDNPSPLDIYLKPRHIKWNYKINETRLSVRKDYRIRLSNIRNRSDLTILRKVLNYSVEYCPKLVGNFYDFFAIHVKYDLPVWPNLVQMMGCSFYYLFRKSHMLQSQIDEWKNALGFHENVVLAIHIREGDNVFGQKNNNADKRFSNKRDIDFSYNCALKIEKIMKRKHLTKSIIWYIAADSEKMKVYAKENYGDKVKHITGPIEHIAHPKKGNEHLVQLTMFLDYFLMQEADYRLYTGPSTFHDAIDFITLGTSNTGTTWSRKKGRTCIVPKTLKDFNTLAKN